VDVQHPDHLADTEIPAAELDDGVSLLFREPFQSIDASGFWREAAQRLFARSYARFPPARETYPVRFFAGIGFSVSGGFPWGRVF
jgi:hypothetical protein